MTFYYTTMLPGTGRERSTLGTPRSRSGSPRQEDPDPGRAQQHDPTSTSTTPPGGSHSQVGTPSESILIRTTPARNGRRVSSLAGAEQIRALHHLLRHTTNSNRTATTIDPQRNVTPLLRLGTEEGTSSRAIPVDALKYPNAYTYNGLRSRPWRPSRALPASSCPPLTTATTSKETSPRARTPWGDNRTLLRPRWTARRRWWKPDEHHILNRYD